MTQRSRMVKYSCNPEAGEHRNMLIKQEGSINEKIKKLFLAKKVIAMILAVAMVATMLPTTTYAATVSGNAPEQSEESTAIQAEIVISESQLQSCRLCLGL